MTRPFAALERLIERLFERPAARIFRASVEPVQLRTRLQRAMDDARRPVEGRVYVPYAYEVRLSLTDAGVLRRGRPGLEDELSGDLMRYARDHGYRLAAQPRVGIVARAGLGRAEVEVVVDDRAPADDAKVDGAPASEHAPRDIGLPGPGAASIRSAPGRPREHGEGNVPAPWAGRNVEATAVLQVPLPVASILLVIDSPDQLPREVLLEGTGCTIGRAADNDLVVVDSQVSRHHGRITVRHGALVYVDLDSTNGSRVNGETVREVVLGIGDVLQVGASAISVLSRD